MRMDARSLKNGRDESRAACRLFVAHPTLKNYLGVWRVCRHYALVGAPCIIAGHRAGRQPRQACFLTSPRCSLAELPEKADPNTGWACPLSSQLEEKECRNIYKKIRGELLLGMVIWIEEFEDEESEETT
jgi:hypothetical protein